MLRNAIYALFLALLATAPAAAGDVVGPTTARAADFGPEQLMRAPEGVAAPVTSTEPVTFAWSLDPTAELDADRAPFAAASRTYRLTVDAAELEAGVALPITSGGAVIRLNPAGPAAENLAVNPATVRMSGPDDEVLAPGSGLDALADAASLKAAGEPFVAGTSAFRMSRDAAAGRYLLTAADVPAGSWVVSVLEADSPIRLEAAADRASYLAGQRAAAEVRLVGLEGIEIDDLEARLVTPDGGERRAAIRRLAGDRYVVSAELAADATRPGVLWEIQASVSGTADGLEVRRDVHTAFAVAVPTARMTGAWERREGSDGIALDVAVEAASTGRYELRAVIWGTDAEGDLRPAAMVHSARVLGAGHGTITLQVDRETLTRHGLTGPWAVRDLRLSDQGRLGVLDHRAEAMVLE